MLSRQTNTTQENTTKIKDAIFLGFLSELLCTGKSTVDKEVMDYLSSTKHNEALKILAIKYEKYSQSLYKGFYANLGKALREAVYSENAPSLSAEDLVAATERNPLVAERISNIRNVRPNTPPEAQLTFQERLEREGPDTQAFVVQGHRH